MEGGTTVWQHERGSGLLGLLGVVKYQRARGFCPGVPQNAKGDERKKERSQ